MYLKQLQIVICLSNHEPVNLMQGNLVKTDYILHEALVFEKVEAAVCKLQ